MGKDKKSKQTTNAVSSVKHKDVKRAKEKLEEVEELYDLQKEREKSNKPERKSSQSMEDRATKKHSKDDNKYIQKRDKLIRYLTNKNSRWTQWEIEAFIDQNTKDAEFKEALKVSIEEIQIKDAFSRTYANEKEIKKMTKRQKPKATIQSLHQDPPELRSISLAQRTLGQYSQQSTPCSNAQEGVKTMPTGFANKFAEEFFKQHEFFQNFSEQKQEGFDETGLLKGTELSILHAIVRQINSLINDQATRVLIEETGLEKPKLYSFSKDSFEHLVKEMKPIHIPHEILLTLSLFDPICLHYFQDSHLSELYLAVFKNSTTGEIMIIASSDANIDTFVPTLAHNKSDDTFYVDFNILGKCFLQTLKQIWLGHGFPDKKLCNDERHFVWNDLVNQNINIDDLAKKISEKIFPQNTVAHPSSGWIPTGMPNLYFYAEGIHPLFINYLLDQVNRDQMHLCEPRFVVNHNIPIPSPSTRPLPPIPSSSTLPLPQTPSSPTRPLPQTPSSPTLGDYSSFIVVPHDFIETYNITCRFSKQESILSELFQLDYRSSERALMYFKVMDEELKKNYSKLSTLEHPMPDTNLYLNPLLDDFAQPLTINETAKTALLHGNFFLFTDKFFFGSYQSRRRMEKIALPLQHTPQCNPASTRKLSKSFFFECIRIFNKSHYFFCFYPFLFIFNDQNNASHKKNNNPHKPLLKQIAFILQEVVYKLREKIGFHATYKDIKGNDKTNGANLKTASLKSPNFLTDFFNYCMYYQIELTRQLLKLNIRIFDLAVIAKEDEWFATQYGDQHKFTSFNDHERQYFILMGNKLFFTPTNISQEKFNSQITSIKQSLYACIKQAYRDCGIIQSHEKEIKQDQSKLDSSEFGSQTASGEEQQSSTHIQAQPERIDPSQSTRTQYISKNYDELDNVTRRTLQKYFRKNKGNEDSEDSEDGEEDAKHAIVIDKNKVLYSRKHN